MAKVTIKIDEQLRSEGGLPGCPAVAADTPKAYGGLEEVMGPTDLFAFSLGACMLTMMGIKAKQLKVEVTGAVAEVEKTMVMRPALMVGKFAVQIAIPQTYPDEIRLQLEEAARNCPIHLSISAEVEQDLTFEWGS